MSECIVNGKRQDVSWKIWNEHYSEETKQKISDGVKKHIKEKNNEI